MLERLSRGSAFNQLSPRAVRGCYHRDLRGPERVEKDPSGQERECEG